MANVTLNEAGIYDVAVGLAPTASAAVRVGSKANVAVTLTEAVASTVKLVDDVRARSDAPKKGTDNACTLSAASVEARAAVSTPRPTRSRLTGPPPIGPIRDSNRPTKL
jgi:hypothetical protein